MQDTCTVAGDLDAVCEIYRWPSGHSMRREQGECPVGNPFSGSWVLRDATGAFVDYDRYRNDIIPRHGLADIEPALCAETSSTRPLTKDELAFVASRTAALDAALDTLLADRPRRFDPEARRAR